MHQVIADCDNNLARMALESISAILEQHGAIIPRPFPAEAVKEMKKTLNGSASANEDSPSQDEEPSDED